MAKEDRMNAKNSYICSVLSTIALLFWAISAQAASLDALMDNFGVQRPRVHKPAPDFTLRSLSGKTVSLSDFRGQPVLLHFWATWCVPCRHEMPLLHALEQQEGNRFHIACVNVDRGDPNRVKAFIDEVTPRFHTLLDPTGAIRNRYAVRGLPTTYLIDADGKISGRMIGERDWSSPAARSMMRALAQGDEK